MSALWTFDLSRVSSGLYMQKSGQQKRSYEMPRL